MEVIWALGSITMNKASGGDGIPLSFPLVWRTENMVRERNANRLRTFYKLYLFQPEYWSGSVSSVTQLCQTLCNPMNSLMYLELVCCSISGSNCCFLTCIQSVQVSVSSGSVNVLSEDKPVGLHSIVNIQNVYCMKVFKVVHGTLVTLLITIFVYALVAVSAHLEKPVYARSSPLTLDTFISFHASVAQEIDMSIIGEGFLWIHSHNHQNDLLKEGWCRENKNFRFRADGFFNILFIPIILHLKLLQNNGYVSLPIKYIFVTYLFYYYVAVYLPGHFFHLLNIQHPDLICHSLFLTENSEVISMLPHSPLQSLSGSLVLDSCSGKLYRALLNQSYLLEFLWNTRLDCEKMALLHCVLSCGRDPRRLEAKIIQWISENISACHSFDLIQEFIIASSYWSIYPETSNMDKLLPYSSLLTWDTEIPGITLVTEEIPLPLMKVHSFKGYWEKLNSNLDYVKYSKPHLYYNNSVVRREWHNLISEEKTGKRRSTVYVRNILDNAIKVISNLEAKNLEPRLTPLFQEEDNHQQLLIGLMVSELRDHLLRHLQGVEKKKIEQMVLDYVSKLLDLICQILEASWRKHNLHPWTLHFNRQASAAEFAVFHIMTRILEATNTLFLPLPLGFHTLHMILGVRCLPLHNLLHYIDHGVLLLTEAAVTRLMKDLDNTEKNEKLKFSIIMRLPPLTGQKICRLWDHPVSSNIISRNHVKRLLQNYNKQPWSSVMDKSSFSVEFLPLNYFIHILTDIESSNPALYAFEGHDNVDAKFVEEAALKHTAMLLGL
ncbi:hypothetical protein FD754_018396 [Muntiacus muntjak]|uniref:Gamma-secretase-activating protein C-terminal domain-containing protein n=1 Tax=Muntiacus muntjak TaxID=9888 RepID=A0A5N3UYD0_MUNMU|nr:hypothetical protein FD754_018396 [Muntiacus muntjak]